MITGKLLERPLKLIATTTVRLIPAVFAAVLGGVEEARAARDPISNEERSARDAAGSTKLGLAVARRLRMSPSDANSKPSPRVCRRGLPAAPLGRAPRLVRSGPARGARLVAPRRTRVVAGVRGAERGRRGVGAGRPVGSVRAARLPLRSGERREADRYHPGPRVAVRSAASPPRPRSAGRPRARPGRWGERPGRDVSLPPTACVAVGHSGSAALAARAATRRDGAEVLDHC